MFVNQKNKIFLVYAIIVILALEGGFYFGKRVQHNGVFLGFNHSIMFIRRGELTQATLLINTADKKTNAIEAKINYDSKKIETLDADTSRNGKQIEVVKILENFLINEVNEEKGNIHLLGFSLDSAYSTNSQDKQLALLNFKANKIGLTKISIDFAGKGSTTGSNIVESGTSSNLLQRVKNLWIVVLP